MGVMAVAFSVDGAEIWLQENQRWVDYTGNNFQYNLPCIFHVFPHIYHVFSWIRRLSVTESGASKQDYPGIQQCLSHKPSVTGFELLPAEINLWKRAQ